MMLSALRSYYLQQMGIDTWVKRNVLPRVSGVHLLAPKRSQSLVLIVCEGGELDEASQWLAGPAGQLLKNMLRSIGLSPDNAALLFGDLSQIQDVLNAHIVHLNPRVIVMLEKNSTCPGLDLGGLSQIHSIQIVQTVHPVDLLNQPHQKKAAFSALMRVQKTLSLESVGYA